MKITHPRLQKYLNFFEENKNIKHFDDFENSLKNLENLEKGDIFEIFCESYLIVIKKFKNIYQSSKIPEEIKEEFSLTNKDYGVDLFGIDNNFDKHFFQIKFRQKRENLNWSGDKLSNLFGIRKDAFGIVMTNSYEIDNFTKEREKSYFILYDTFEKLEKEELENIFSYILENNFKKREITLYDFQKKIVDDIEKKFEIEKRLTCPMACGTGKTFIGLKIVQTYQEGNILMLFPTLSLLEQTLKEYLKFLNYENFPAIISIHSDKSNKNYDEDEIIFSKNEIDFPVSTDEEEVKNFLKKENKLKLIFSTYQSCEILGNSLKKLNQKINLCIFDEAHKTAGNKEKKFAFALKDENIKIEKRLFLTATPKIYSLEKDKDENQKVFLSMDDEKVFGKKTTGFSFRDAIKEKWICDYKIFTSIITSAEINNELEKSATIIKGDEIKSIQIATQLAVKNIIKKKNLKKIISYHPNINQAKSFCSENENEGVKKYLPDFSTLHINGKNNLSKRSEILRKFKKDKLSIISNSKCLTEGINIPAVDCVVFTTAKKSKIDIIQAIGRCLRKSEGKEFGYILLPIFLDTEKENLDEEIEEKNFEVIFNVLNSLKDYDHNLAILINELQSENIKKKGFNFLNNFPIGFDMDEKYLKYISEEDLVKNIKIKLIEKNSDNWEVNFNLLKNYKKEIGNCDVLYDYKIDNKNLGYWVSYQRTSYKKNSLDKNKIKKLEEIGFKWTADKTEKQEFMERLADKYLESIDYKIRISTSGKKFWLYDIKEKKWTSRAYSGMGYTLRTELYNFLISHSLYEDEFTNSNRIQREVRKIADILLSKGDKYVLKNSLPIIDAKEEVRGAIKPSHAFLREISFERVENSGKCIAYKTLYESFKVYAEEMGHKGSANMSSAEFWKQVKEYMRFVCKMTVVDSSHSKKKYGKMVNGCRPVILKDFTVNTDFANEYISGLADILIVNEKKI